MTLDSLQPLLKELDACRKAGLDAELWWRDDDAVAPSVELDRLFAVSNRHDVPCGLAADPTRAGEPLRKTVSAEAHIWILEHGAGAGDADPHQPKSSVLEDLRQGMLKFKQLFKDRFVPVVVPMHDRIDPELLAYLPVMGFRGLSSVHREHGPVPPGDLRVADVHCDLVARSENESPRFAGAEPCVAALVEHLHDKRTGKIDETVPTGIRTRHADMDAEAWEFLEALFDLTTAHPAARWISPAAIWAPLE